jgi:hypothetical protein
MHDFHHVTVHTLDGLRVCYAVGCSMSSMCSAMIACCSLQPAVAPNDEDQEALLTVRGIWSILQPNFRWQLEGDQRQRVWEEIYPLLPELLPGLSLIGLFIAFALLPSAAASDMRRLGCP